MSYPTLADPFPMDYDAYTQEFVLVPFVPVSARELEIIRRNEEDMRLTRQAENERVNLVVTKSKAQLQAEIAKFEKDGVGHIWLDDSTWRND